MFNRLSKNAASLFYKEYRSVKPHMKPAIVAAVGVELIKKGLETVQDHKNEEKINRLRK